MPSSIDVSPTIGHALLTSQLGIGATPGYDSIDLRRVCAIGAQEGAHTSGAWKVSQSATPAMSVDIAADVGLATVQGDSIAGQSLYVVAPHSATATLTIITADATNPRLDQIVLQIYDTTYDGSGNNKATMMVVTGTPTGGATIDNRNGAAALPNSALLLADVFVAAGAATVTTSSIRDRRKRANGIAWQGYSINPIALTSTSATHAVDTGWFQPRLELSGGPVMVVAAMYGSMSVGGVNAFSGFTSGTDTTFAQISSGSGVNNFNLSYGAMFVPSVAGSQLVTLTASVASGTLTLADPAVFAVRELAPVNI